MLHIDEIQCYFGRQIGEIQPNMKAGAIGAHTFLDILVGPRQAAWHQWLASVSDAQKGSWLSFSARKQAHSLSLK